MRNVVFVAPYPLETTMSFVAGLSSVDDVRMLGIFQKPPEGPSAAAFAARCGAMVVTGRGPYERQLRAGD